MQATGFLLFFIILFNTAFCQHPVVTAKPKELKEIRIKLWMRRDIARLPEEQNGFVYAGKKNEVASIGNTNANIAIKTGRQLFAKVPSILVKAVLQAKVLGGSCV